MREAIAEYVIVAARRLRPASAVTLSHRLGGILRLALNRPTVELTPRVADELYSLRATEVAVDTHRGELTCASAFGEHGSTAGWWAVNPFAAIRPLGERNARHSRLRVDAARVFVRAALAENSDASVVAALALLTGVRASEGCERLVDDVDDRGSILRITAAKTSAGVRELEIPSVLRPLIAARCEGRGGAERLFPGLTRHALHYHVRRLCRLAGVPEVTPHDLRRSFTSLAVRSGVSTEYVARALGHAGTDVTRRHYLDGGAEASAGGRRAEERLLAETNASGYVSTAPLRAEGTKEMEATGDNLDEK